MPAAADPATRISGPHVHENLALFFIHGPSAPGPVPLTLAEALAKGNVRVMETGTVNELKIENTGDEDIFIQSGDLVKGGRQDRVLTMSFVLPPKSGEVPLAAFCVEHGRWSARGMESVAMFAGASEAMPSRAAKLAMRAPVETSAVSGPQQAVDPARANPASVDVHARQQQVWAEVEKTQQELSARLTASVAAPESATSLQLSLENERLKDARAAYMAALERRGAEGDDIVGYVIAINGKVSSADVYPSNGLFRKMWAKQLAAGVTEAIGTRTDSPAAAPSKDDVARFLAAAEQGRASKETVANVSQQEVRDADLGLFIEARRTDGVWVHRNYLAK
jgi:hypothetical protein